MTERKSIHDQAPIEIGGVKARKGFSYQDHVAAGFCLAMHSNEALKAVWCETQDDITLIWAPRGVEEVEFVQVKSNELNQLWTPSELCKREHSGAKGKGTSILERSLAHDRNTETSHFRIVTLRDVHASLNVLTLPVNSPAREPAKTEICALKTDIADRLPGATSPNGNGVTFWIERALWEVKESEKAVRNENLLTLRKVAESMDIFLATDQLDEIYQKVLAKLQSAALAEWGFDPRLKKILRKDFCKWLREIIGAAAHPALYGTGENLRAKMESAGLSQEDIWSAEEARRAYRAIALRPQYQQSEHLKSAEYEIIAKLQELRSQLDAGQIEETGTKFHSRCLATLEQFKARVHLETPSVFLQGFMYNITDRCLHRFKAVTA